MNFEDLQKAWQSQDARAKVTINADVLMKEVRRNQQQFWRTIFWRDAREVVVIFLLGLFFLHDGMRHHKWDDYLLAFAGFGVCATIVADRLRQRGKRPAANDSLKACVESSLHQVSHQIWLLQNIFWWYLLPIVAALGISFSVSLWHSRHDGITAVIVFAFNVLFCILVYWGVYRLNQHVVRKSLEPRRQELETLLAALK